MAGNRLKILRKRLNMDQKKFSSKLGCTQGALSLYETDKRSLPDEIIAKLIDITNCNINWLYTGQGDMFISPPDDPDTPGNTAQNELTQLKKSIFDLEQRNTQLQIENQRLNNELVACLKELLSFHKAHPKLKE